MSLKKPIKQQPQHYQHPLWGKKKTREAETITKNHGMAVSTNVVPGCLFFIVKAQTCRVIRRCPRGQILCHVIFRWTWTPLDVDVHVEWSSLEPAASS